MGTIWTKKGPLRYQAIDEAMLLLGRERWERIPRSILTPEKKKILFYLIESDKFISQKEIVKLFSKAASNISSYFKELREHNIIEEKEKTGKNIYFGLTEEYEPLKFFLESQKKVQDNIVSQTKQLTLFNM